MGEYDAFEKKFSSGLLLLGKTFFTPQYVHSNLSLSMRASRSRSLKVVVVVLVVVTCGEAQVK